MIKKLLPNLGSIKTHYMTLSWSYLSNLEILIPFLMSKIIDIGVKNSDELYNQNWIANDSNGAIFPLIWCIIRKICIHSKRRFSKNLRKACLKRFSIFLLKY